MYRGTIIENSLSDREILEKVKIIKSYRSGDWALNDVLVADNQIQELSKSIADGPWYIHLWQPGKDEVKVIYRDKMFDIMFSDKSTWAEAVAHGKSLGIPSEQLDFPID